MHDVYARAVRWMTEEIFSGYEEAGEQLLGKEESFS